MKIVTATIAGLLMSGSALAGAEVGAIVGYDSMSASSGGDSLSGLAFGLRGGTRTDSGLAFEGQFLRHSGSTEVMGIEASVNQMVIGAGTRFYIGDGNVTPFVGGHLNYHLGAKASVMGISASVPGSSGLGLDAAGGAQFGIGDTLYAEALAYYSLQLTGDIKYNTLAFGAGFGAKF